MIACLTPVLDRPENAMRVALSLRATGSHRLVFLCSPGDDAEIAACRAAVREIGQPADVLVMDFTPGPGDYAKKVNAGVRATVEPWLFQAGDDIDYRPGWAEEALRVAERTGARVIGTNDLCNPRVMGGKHATHNLVARSYVEEIGTVDVPGVMLHEGYEHNFVDDELVQAARFLREWAFARDAEVEHLHPFCGHGELDATYNRGQAGFHADRQILRRRTSIWRRRYVRR